MADNVLSWILLLFCVPAIDLEDSSDVMRNLGHHVVAPALETPTFRAPR
jgi:hypothetical protein